MKQPLITNISEDWWDGRNGSSFFPSVYYRGDKSNEGFLRAAPLGQAARTVREVEMIEVEIRRRFGSRSAKPLRILDCPCGEGRHSLELARRGYIVHGIDLCPEAVAAAKQKLATASNIVRDHCSFQTGDMRDLEATGTYDVVINMFFSFGFFDDAGNAKTLASFARSLRPGGLLLIHTDVNPHLLVSGEYGDTPHRTLADGAHLKVSERWNKLTNRLEGAWEVTDPDGSMVNEAYSVRIYNVEELQRMFTQCGLVLRGERAVPVFSYRPAIEEAQDVVFVASKA
jgi:SAM-dependent methyltransferase